MPSQNLLDSLGMTLNDYSLSMSLTGLFTSLLICLIVYDFLRS